MRMQEIEFMEAVVRVANIIDKFPDSVFKWRKSILRVKKSNKELHDIAFSLKLGFIKKLTELSNGSPDKLQLI